MALAGAETSMTKSYFPGEKILTELYPNEKGVLLIFKFTYSLLVSPKQSGAVPLKKLS